MTSPRAKEAFEAILLLEPEEAFRSLVTFGDRGAFRSYGRISEQANVASGSGSELANFRSKYFSKCLEQ